MFSSTAGVVQQSVRPTAVGSLSFFFGFSRLPPPSFSRWCLFPRGRAHEVVVRMQDHSASDHADLQKLDHLSSFLGSVMLFPRRNGAAPSPSRAAPQKVLCVVWAAGEGHEADSSFLPETFQLLGRLPECVFLVLFVLWLIGEFFMKGEKFFFLIPFLPYSFHNNSVVVVCRYVDARMNKEFFNYSSLPRFSPTPPRKRNPSSIPLLFPTVLGR